MEKNTFVYHKTKGAILVTEEEAEKLLKQKDYADTPAKFKKAEAEEATSDKTSADASEEETAAESPKKKGGGKKNGGKKK